MAVKYHITKSGKAAECGATVRVCPLGGEHYDSMREAALAAVAGKPGGTSFARIPKDQAEHYLKSLSPYDTTEEKLEGWLVQDNSEAIAALEHALRLDTEEERLALLVPAGLATQGTYYNDHWGTYEPTGRYSLVGATHHKNGSGITDTGIKQAIRHHKLRDRTTLMTAMDIDPGSVRDGGEVLYSTIAKGLADDLHAERRAEKAAKEAARKAAPTDWVKIPVKTVRDELGDHYDEANPQHREFEKELEAIDMTRDQYFARPGYRRRDEYKNMVIKRVKARHQKLTDEAAMGRVPDSVDWQKTGAAKLAEALGPKYDSSLPLHQELRAKVDAMTSPYSGKVYRDPDGRPARQQHTHRREGRWVANDEVASPTEEQREVVRQDQVDSHIEDLFTPYKSDRADILRGFKKRLAEQNVSS